MDVDVAPGPERIMAMTSPPYLSIGVDFFEAVWRGSQAPKRVAEVTGTPYENVLDFAGAMYFDKRTNVRQVAEVLACALV